MALPASVCVCLYAHLSQLPFCVQVEEKIRLLKEQYEEKLKQKDELQRQAEMTERKLDRAGKLVAGLAGERERWIVTAEVGRGWVWSRKWEVGWITDTCIVSAVCGELVYMWWSGDPTLLLSPSPAEAGRGHGAPPW